MLGSQTALHFLFQKPVQSTSASSNPCKVTARGSGRAWKEHC